MLRVVILALCLAYASAVFLKRTSCLSSEDYPNTSDIFVEVSDCPHGPTNSSRCNLVKGLTYQVQIKWNCSVSTDTSLKFGVSGMFGTLAIPYGPTKPACNDIVDEQGNTCVQTNGLQEGKIYIHESSFAVSKFFPTIQLTVRFVLINEADGKKLFCVDVPVKICNSV